MRFDKPVSKKKHKEIEEQQVGAEEPQEDAEPAELEKAIESEADKTVEPVEAPAGTPVREEPVSKEVYETEEGKTILQYQKSKDKGYCELRERTKSVYGIKYAAGKGMDLAKKAKVAIMDWCKILPRKGSAEREDKEDLV